MNSHGLPFFDQYFGVWAIESQRFAAMYDRTKNINLALHVQSSAPEEVRAAQSGSKFQRVGKVAVVSLSGVLMKQESSMQESTSTVEARRKIRAAALDEDVSAIVIAIDSPGGTVSGTQSLAADVAAAAKQKPVYAQIDDLGASAAYWVASQATKVFAGPTALVGSIGTYSVVYDMSGTAAMEGIKVHVVKAGEFKGAGVQGTEVTTEQLNNWQKMVNDLNDHFIQGVAHGRGMSVSQIKSIADGRVHIAEQAKQLGLIDGVQSLDETVRQLSSRTAKGLSMNAEAVVDTPVANVAVIATSATPQAAAVIKPVAATLAEMKENCIGANSDFLIKQLEAGATLQQAMKAWMTEQQTQIATAAAAPPKAETARPGVAPLGGNSASAVASADPIAAFNDAVEMKMKAGKPKHVATSEVCHEQPEIREAYVVAFNANAPRRSRKAS